MDKLNNNYMPGSWTWLKKGSVQISTGEKYIFIAGREDSFEVDKIVFFKK